MSDLAAFLELVHTATTRWQTVVATVDYEMDLEALRSGTAKVFGAAGLNLPPPPGMTTMPTGIEIRPFRVSARGREFVRIEQTGEQHTIALIRPDGTASCTAGGDWTFEAAVETSQFPPTRMPIRFGFPAGGTQSFGMITMLDASELLGTIRFQGASDAEIEGRSALQAVGRPVKSAFPPGLGTNGLHPATTSIEVAVDRETGILLRLCERSDSGMLTTRTLRIETVDGPIDDDLFEMPSDVEATKESRGTERFDNPASLAASVAFAVYTLDPAPANATPLCMRESPSSARITYLTGMQSMAAGRLMQPINLTSARPKGGEPKSPGDSWEQVTDLAVEAWIWSAENNGQTRSHVRLRFGDADVELSGEFSRDEAVKLARTIRKA